MAGCGSGSSGDPERTPEAAMCVPGTSAGCSCTDGRTGAQECDADGLFGRCVCETPESPTNSGGPSAGGSAGQGPDGEGGEAPGPAAGNAGIAAKGGAGGAVPSSKVLLSDVTSFALGSSHSCALLGGGDVRCWGRNDQGQLGDQTLAAKRFPVSVSGLDGDVIGIAAASVTTCAVLSDATVRCWGGASSDDLSYGTSARALAEPSEVVQIRGYYESYCAILKTGGLRCWGGRAQQETPYPFSSGVVDAAIGGLHRCALLENGQVGCAGSNLYGQRGTGGPASSTNTSTFLATQGLESGVQAIAAGYLHGCALLDDGTVKCWGQNERGQLGGGADADEAFTPVLVPNVADAVAISAGGDHACVLLKSGRVSCWGENSEGQCGNGSSGSTALPGEVVGVEDAISVFTGSDHSCAILKSGNAKCWGYNASGQLGDGTTNNQPSPVDVRER